MIMMNMFVIDDINDDEYIHSDCNDVHDFVIIVPKVSSGRGSVNYGYGLATCSST